jgi:hypothetical protein
MTLRFVATSLMVLALAGCGGNPFVPDDTPDEEAPLGGTGNAAGSAVTRYEKLEEASGNGYVTKVDYDEGDPLDSTDDTFLVDNLAFDGQAYSQNAVGTGVMVNPDFAVYENPDLLTDPLSGATIDSFLHRAIYGQGESTRFTIVRTGAYEGYGFGGFLFSRTGGMTFPTDLGSSGVAIYTGGYAALRDFVGQTGLEYATGSMEIAIDFNDFNSGDAVAGQVTDRKIYDLNGVEVTQDVIDALNTNNSSALTELPTLVFAVGPGVISDAGEVTGELRSTTPTTDGPVVYESGNYYAILSGEGLDQEVVGVIVVTSEDPRAENVGVRETGGFILYR